MSRKTLEDMTLGEIVSEFIIINQRFYHHLKENPPSDLLTKAYEKRKGEIIKELDKREKEYNSYKQSFGDF